MPTPARAAIFCSLLVLSACEQSRMTSGTVPTVTVSSSNSRVETLTDETFQRQVILSPVPVLVDCWAPWCSPCLGMEPTINELAAEYGGSVRIGKLDVTANASTATQYDISALPVFLIFKRGALVDRVVGYQTKPNLKARIDAAMR